VGRLGEVVFVPDFVPREGRRLLTITAVVLPLRREADHPEAKSTLLRHWTCRFVGNWTLGGSGREERRKRPSGSIFPNLQRVVPPRRQHTCRWSSLGGLRSRSCVVCPGGGIWVPLHA
jgi:hypothetical protein